jgi:hypothetical protein
LKDELKYCCGGEPRAWHKKFHQWTVKRSTIPGIVLSTIHVINVLMDEIWVSM